MITMKEKKMIMAKKMKKFLKKIRVKDADVSH
jgi:hypothetical protein